jgi:hypothetical protein
MQQHLKRVQLLMCLDQNNIIAYSHNPDNFESHNPDFFYTN